MLTRTRSLTSHFPRFPLNWPSSSGSGRQFCVMIYLGPFFGCIFGPFFGPFLELEYLGLGGVETYDLFKNPFGALFGAFFGALFNDTELTPRSSRCQTHTYDLKIWLEPSGNYALFRGSTVMSSLWLQKHSSDMNPISDRRFSRLAASSKSLPRYVVTCYALNQCDVIN